MIMKQKIKSSVPCMIIVVLCTMFLISLIYAYGPSENKVVRNYIKENYYTDSIVFRTGASHNESGFTAGLYQYNFDVYGIGRRVAYQVTYAAYDDLTEETVDYAVVTPLR